MKKNKHFYAFMLAMLIIFFAVFEPLNTIAAPNKGIKPTSEWTGNDWYQICAYLAGKIGAMGDGVIDAVHDFTNGYFTADGLKEKFDDFKSGVTVKDGKVVVSSDALNNFKGLMDAAIADVGPYYYYKTPDIDFIDFSSIPNGNLFRQDFAKVLNGGLYAVASNKQPSQYGFEISMFDISNRYLVEGINSDEMILYDQYGGLVVKQTIYKFTISLSSGKSNFYVGGTDDYQRYYYKIQTPMSRYVPITVDGRYIRVFKSLSALNDYLRGKQTNYVYTSTNYNNYNYNVDNSVSIDAGTAEYIFQQGDSLQLDMSKVVNNISSEISNYYVNNSTAMSQQDIQNAIDTALQKFLDSLPSGGGEKPTEPETPSETETPSEPETETGGDISGNDVSGNGVDGPKTVGLLTKIYNKLSQVFNLLKGEILGALNGIKSAVSGGGVSGNDVSGNGVSGNDAPSDGTSWFQKIYDKLSEIKRAIIGNTVVGGLGDLLSTAVDKLVDLADTVKDSVVSVVPEVTDAVSDILDGTEETIGKMVDNVGTNFKPVGDKMKTKFPFSIPWDIAAVVGSLSAAPETPVFEIPIVFERYDIDYTLTVDMADFEVISKISRLFLSLTFVLFLTKLTIQVVKMEKEL